MTRYAVKRRYEWNVEIRPTQQHELDVRQLNELADIENGTALVEVNNSPAAIFNEYGTCVWKDEQRFPKADHDEWFEGMASFAMELLAVAMSEEPARDDAGNALAPRRESP